MANRRDATTLIVVALLALVVGGVGLWLGFRPVRPHSTGRPVPKPPDQGPIIYEMTSIFSEPNRIQLHWKNVAGAAAYRVTLMTATDDSLFASDSLKTNAWTIPDSLRGRLPGQSVYHWKLTVLFDDRPAEHSEPAAFATQ
ncbi:MAG TPA: hypothetical protein VFS09_03845 [Candidatus Eisenbacteria bacterium]|nr:hypothetical protein [Candidatus Eisenbacteria bacterium]